MCTKKNDNLTKDLIRIIHVLKSCNLYAIYIVSQPSMYTGNKIII